MTVKLYLFAALLGLSAAVQAQTDNTTSGKSEISGNCPGKHNLYLSTLFTGRVMSVKYEFHLKQHQRGLGAFAGIGVAPTYVEPEKHAILDEMMAIQRLRLAVPFGINYLVGKPNKGHRLEFGVGFTYVDGDVPFFDDEITPCTWLMTGTLAYRYYALRNRFMTKIAFTPMMSLTGSPSSNGSVIPWFEAGVGIRL